MKKYQRMARLTVTIVVGPNAAERRFIRVHNALFARLSRPPTSALPTITAVTRADGLALSSRFVTAVEASSLRPEESAGLGVSRFCWSRSQLLPLGQEFVAERCEGESAVGGVCGPERPSVDRASGCGAACCDGVL